MVARSVQNLRFSAYSNISFFDICIASPEKYIYTILAQLVNFQLNKKMHYRNSDLIRAHLREIKKRDDTWLWHLERKQKKIEELQALLAQQSTKPRLTR